MLKNLPLQGADCLEDLVLWPEERRPPDAPAYIDVLEVNTKCRFDKKFTRIAVYPRIVGYVVYKIFDSRRGINMIETKEFDRNLYVPIPFVKRGVDSMRFIK